MNEIILSIDDLKIKFCKQVYQPSDDSYLLYDTVKQLKLKGKIAEVGSGTGLITLMLAHNNLVIASDLNIMAAKCTLENLKNNNLDDNVDVLCCDNLTPIRDGEIFDYIVFNPPYIPTKTINEEDISWSGGKEGIEVTINFLKESIKRLKQSGRIVCVLSSIMNLKALTKYIEELGYKTKILTKKKFFFETLYVVIIEKPSI